ncbi:DUF92 domain-containing protein [Puia dinghuensis]|nr:DUF92 domain-containing protein [Puia dinghuensis]
MRASDLIVILLLLAGAAASIYWKKLTPAAAITGVITGSAIYAGGGYPGLLFLALFFILGTAATSWRKQDKLLVRGTAAHETTRRAGQVIANAGVAAIAGLLAILLPADKPLFLLLMAASFSSATADTLASELGMVYGRRFYHLLTLKPDQRGLDGVVSIEGLLLGIAGSTLIAAAYAGTTGWNIRPIAIIILAGTAGNLIDSLLGALFERKGLLTNDTVNFLNTLAAALIAAVLY